jgi:hypothetical protein
MFLLFSYQKKLDISIISSRSSYKISHGLWVERNFFNFEKFIKVKSDNKILR